MIWESGGINSISSAQAPRRGSNSSSTRTLRSNCLQQRFVLHSPNMAHTVWLAPNGTVLRFAGIVTAPEAATPNGRWTVVPGSELQQSKRD